MDKIYNCSLCSSKEVICDDNLNSKSHFNDIFKCLSCGHFFTRLNEKNSQEDLYNDKVYKVIENRGSIFDKIIQYESKKLLRKAKGVLGKEIKSFLDFGCGKGHLLYAAKKDGCPKTVGVETAIERANYGKKFYGLKIYTENYEKGLIGDSKYDVVSLLHVLEHLDRPKNLLINLIQFNLEDKGCMILEVPNIKSIQSKIAKSKWLHLDTPKHLHHFSKDTLHKLIKDIGMQVEKIEYFSFHLGVLGMLDSLLKKLFYKKHIIFELKHNMRISTVFLLCIFLPLAVFLEILSSIFKSGGVLRFYLKKHSY